MMEYIQEISQYIPANDQEKQDKKVILEYIKLFPQNSLLRDNEVAHITSSGFIVNYNRDKALMIHHNIRNAWAWTGGHMDGETDLLGVAIKEAKEETGLLHVTPLSNTIASLDILPTQGHIRKNKYVNAHLHFSVAYLLIADEKETLIINEDENSAVQWFPFDSINEKYFDATDIYLYNKLIQDVLGKGRKNV